MSTVASWKSTATPPPANSLTFGHQSNLKKLPVPPLADTLARVKNTIAPLAWSTEELNAAYRKIDEFGKSDGVGPLLQQRLQKWDQGHDHWLEEWWDTVGYLGYRESVSLPLMGFKSS